MQTDSKKHEPPTDANNVLAVGLLVRLKTDHEEHRGKHFKVENTDTSLIKVSWQNRIYHFYDSELEVVKPYR
jgi:hypothetical protein